MTACLHDAGFCARHDLPGHAENARRLERIVLPAAWPRIAPRPATDAELLAVHTPDHLGRIAAMVATGGGMLDPDTYCGPDSEAVARAVAGGLVDLCLAVWRGEHPNGLAIMRPPGHHARRDQVMGFCLYNQVAVAAAALRRAGAGRVAILDFDVHHGNGTQDIFDEDASVLFVSSHQYPHYPGTGRADERGRGAGLGFTLNVPLAAGTGDAGFLAAWRDTLLPAVAAFRPDMMLVSAGYDAHAADPLAGLEVTTGGFATLVDLIVATSEICGGRLVFSLEGGYDPAALADCVDETARRLPQTPHR